MCACLCSLLLTYSEVDLAATHHIVQEGVLSHQLQAHTETQRHRVNENITQVFMCVKQYTINRVTHIRHKKLDLKCKYA